MLKFENSNFNEDRKNRQGVKLHLDENEFNKNLSELKFLKERLQLLKNSSNMATDWPNIINFHLNKIEKLINKL